VKGVLQQKKEAVSKEAVSDQQRKRSAVSKEAVSDQ
jgi:hypothetical protein